MATSTRVVVQALLLLALPNFGAALLASCPAGAGMPNGATDCTECPPGTWSAEGMMRCEDCAMGHYSTEYGSSTCQLCPAGTWSSRRGAFDSSFCEPCAPGSHNSLEGSTSIDACIKCPRGSYSEHSGSAECDLCPPGTYGPFESADSRDMCTNCPAGTFQDHPGQPSEEVCYGCGPGTYSDVGAGRCRACPSGTWNNDRAAQQCQACPTGTWTRQPRATSAAQCQRCYEQGQEWCGSTELEVQSQVQGVNFALLSSTDIKAFKKGFAEGISAICEVPLDTVVAPSGENSSVALSFGQSGLAEVEAYVVESVLCTFDDLKRKIHTTKFRTELQKSVGTALAPAFDMMSVTVRSVTQTTFEMPETTTTLKTTTSSSSSSTTAVPTTTTAAPTTTTKAAQLPAAGEDGGAQAGATSGGSFLSTSKSTTASTTRASLAKDLTGGSEISRNTKAEAGSEGGGLPSWFWGILGGIVVALLVLLWHIIAARRRLKKGEEEKEVSNEPAPGVPADGTAATVPDGKDTERFANLQGPRSLSAPDFLRTTMDDVEESGMHMWFDGEVAEGPRSSYDCTKGCTVWC